MKENTGKIFSFRAKWLSILYAGLGYILLSIQNGKPLTLDQTWPLIAVASFIFITALPVAVSFWIKMLGEAMSIAKGAKNGTVSKDDTEKSS